MGQNKFQQANNTQRYLMEWNHCVCVSQYIQVSNPHCNKTVQAIYQKIKLNIKKKGQKKTLRA